MEIDENLFPFLFKTILWKKMMTMTTIKNEDLVKIKINNKWFLKFNKYLINIPNLDIENLKQNLVIKDDQIIDVYYANNIDNAKFWKTCLWKNFYKK